MGQFKLPFGALAVVVLALAVVAIQVISAEFVVPIKPDNAANTMDYSHNLTQSPQIHQLLDFFNVERLATKWPVIGQRLNTNCSRHMERYFQGLVDHQLWALKSNEK